MKIAILDNYDSFTYNLKHYLEKISNEPVDVFLNDAVSVEQLARYSKIVLSPGPGLPKDAGIMPDFLKQCGHSHDILGVCLGLQAIGECFGHSLKNLETVMHGLATPIKHSDKNGLFKNIPNSFLVGRYHSWALNENSHSDLMVTARDEHQNIMAVQHKTLKVCGVQFHPESILSEYGEHLLRNWLTL